MEIGLTLGCFFAPDFQGTTEYESWTHLLVQPPGNIQVKRNEPHGPTVSWRHIACPRNLLDASDHIRIIPEMDFDFVPRRGELSKGILCHLLIDLRVVVDLTG